MLGRVLGLRLWVDVIRRMDWIGHSEGRRLARGSRLVLQGCRIGLWLSFRDPCWSQSFDERSLPSQVVIYLVLDSTWGEDHMQERSRLALNVGPLDVNTNDFDASSDIVC